MVKAQYALPVLWQLSFDVGVLHNFRLRALELFLHGPLEIVEALIHLYNQYAQLYLCKTDSFSYGIFCAQVCHFFQPFKTTSL
jgi:hypothetical protein